MSNLATYTDQHESILKIIQPVLAYFAKLNLSSEIENNIKIAADKTYSDEILLERFEDWNDDKDDELFLFHINRYVRNLDIEALPPEQRDVTYIRESAEDSIKKSVRNEKARIFGERVSALALNHDLTTNKELGVFLGISEEEARRYKEGVHKPQAKTIKKVADKFEVSMEYLVGISDNSSL